LAVEGPLFCRLEGVFSVAGVDVQLRHIPGSFGGVLDHRFAVVDAEEFQQRPKHRHRIALGVFGAEMKTLSRVVALEPPGSGNAFAPVAGKGLGEIAEF
jgi:hypothetical protein